jgi:hypothetical protein
MRYATTNTVHKQYSQPICGIIGPMQITIDLPPDLEQDLRRQAAQSQVPLQTLILQSLRKTVQGSSVATPATPQWPESILAYEGVPDFPPFES